MKEEILNLLAGQSGETGFVYRNLATGESIVHNAHHAFVAASIIKLPILMTAFEQMEKGLLDPDEVFRIRQEQCCPSCGALTYLHRGIEVTLMDLCVLMIILSDNTATNLLIERIGIEKINRAMLLSGMRESVLRRKLFDAEKAAQGIENTVSPIEIADLLDKMAQGKLVSPEADAKMLSILKNQRLNGKIPFFLPHSVPIAHKTGEDGGITHDCGIVFAQNPYVLCLMSEHTDVPRFERCIQDISKMVYQMNCPNG